MKKTVFAAMAAVVIGFMAAVTLCVRTLSAAQPVFAADDGFKIVLDAGHGGIDGGVTGKTTGVKESDLNLSITLTLKDVLEEMGFSVTLTRKTEAGLYDTTAKGFKKRDMQKRKDIIQETDPSLVVSIHQNYYPTGATRGAQVFYDGTSANGKSLAHAVQARLNDVYNGQGAKSRNCMTGQYFMLQCCAAPSVIVECGFLSNAADERLLCTKEWQRTLAESIAVGIMDYLSQQTA